MTKPTESPPSTKFKHYGLHALAIVVGTAAVVGLAYFVLPMITSVSYFSGADVASSTTPVRTPIPKPQLDVAAHNRKLLALAHVATSSPWYEAFMVGTTIASTTIPKPIWPHKTVYPNAGAILPASRILAYYGNFYSTGMGVLGEYPEDVVLDKLKTAVAEWEAADPTTPVLPAIEYIDVTAQGSPGKEGKYRLRMPDSQIDIALAMAKKINGIVILDIQVGLSTLQDELPLLESYLKMPEVHLALDPEFAMHNGAKPGTVIGSFDAVDINYAINYLSKLVQENNLPPKILVVHRFTENMVTNYQNIKPTPEVQVVMQMDGWGSPQRKKNTYYTVVAPEPVQFTGLKLFYKNDLKEDPPRLLTKDEVLGLTPTPIFIQYQ